MSEKIEKPEGLDEKHLIFLDNLRESGVVNMFGARPFLVEEFDLDERAAGKILSYWMKTFSERHPEKP